jgi:predicted RNA-binding protein YlxR (DUF448 family)
MAVAAPAALVKVSKRQMTKVKTAVPSKKHIPQRTCIACRKTDAKRGLIRLVCVDKEVIEIDPTGKKSGRGAYLCSAGTCWENALNSGKLEYALRTSLKAETKEKLVNYAKGFNNTDNGIKRS